MLDAKSKDRLSIQKLKVLFIMFQISQLLSQIYKFT